MSDEYVLLKSRGYDIEKISVNYLKRYMVCFIKKLVESRERIRLQLDVFGTL